MSKKPIIAVIMAGGKSSRFNFDKIKLNICEKALLPIDISRTTSSNINIIDLIIKTVIDSSKITEICKIIIAVSNNTPETTEYLQKMKLPEIEIMETPGINYHSDLQFIAKKLKPAILLILNCDTPLIKPNNIKEVIHYFNYPQSSEIDSKINSNIKKSTLTVMSPLSLFEKSGITPSYIETLDNGQKLVPIGINVIDADFIKNGEFIDQNILTLDYEELLYNINDTGNYFKFLEYYQQHNHKS